MTDDIRWAVAGPGSIAGKVLADLAHVDGASLTAVGSRSLERAQAFADRHGAPRAHGSYRALLDDPDVDVVYIATPHPQHHAIALAALHAGKALLVEKAFTATAAGTREVVALARETGLFAMEAMWTRFQPAVVRLRDLIADGAIGDVRAVQADLGIAPPYNPTTRYFDPAQGGGALLDLGVYPVSFAQMLLGTPDTVTVAGSLTPSGVDAEESLLLGWADGRQAALTSSLRCQLPGQARVFGTGGWIDVLPRFHHTQTIVLHRDGVDAEEITRPATGAGYSHELAEVTECLRAGRSESAVMPLADTVTVMEVLEQAAGRLGVRFAEAADVM